MSLSTLEYYCYVCGDLVTPPHNHEGELYRRLEGEGGEELFETTAGENFCRPLTEDNLNALNIDTLFTSREEVETYLAREIGGLVDADYS